MSNLYHAKRKPIKCPKCGSKPVARILYGMPDFDEDLEHDIEEGKIVLGGCCEKIGDPTWRCSKCDTSVFREEDTDNTYA